MTEVFEERGTLCLNFTELFFIIQFFCLLDSQNPLFKLKSGLKIMLLISARLLAQFRPLFHFTKHSRPLPKLNRERTRSKAISDDKSGKLAKAEQEQEQKQAQENLKKRLELEKLRASQPKINTWSSFYEYYLPRETEEAAQTLAPAPRFLADSSIEGKRRLRNKYPLAPADISDQLNSQFQLNMHTYDDPLAKPLRAGVIATKVGMTAQWDKWGIRHTLTVLQLDNNQVVQVKTPEKDGHSAIQVGAGLCNLKRLKKPQMGHFLKANVPPKKYLREFPITPENALPVGYIITARHFVPGQYVDIQGVSCGKGFQGTIKRHNFSLQPATHGCSLSHRMLGSTGQRQDPGRVFKGKKMPGRMGNEKVTLEKIRIYKIDAARQLIYVRGSVPGKAGNVVYLRDSLKGARKNQGLINYPTLVIEKDKEYAREIIMEPPLDDPQIQELHENDLPQAGDEGDE